MFISLQPDGLNILAVLLAVSRHRVINQSTGSLDQSLHSLNLPLAFLKSNRLKSVPLTASHLHLHWFNGPPGQV